MTLIDQRILIDAPQDVVWDFVTRPDHITQWHTGYAGISVLTTDYMTVGTRRRCALVSGAKDIIEEITAIVNGIGYEYVIVEGSTYQEFMARIRLQAGPDGTSVQWTIDYKPKGLFGQITDRLRGKKQAAAMMAASLRQLRHQVDQQGVRMDAAYRERVGMRDRLDFNERAQYQRRHAPPPGVDPIGTAEQPAEPPHPAAGETAVESVEASPSPAPVEPAPAPSPVHVPPSGAVPSFVNELIQEEGEADYSHKADTKPRKPEGLREAIEQQAASLAQAPHISEESVEPPTVEPPPPATIEPPPPTGQRAQADGDHTRTTPPRGTALEQPVTPFVAPQMGDIPPAPEATRPPISEPASLANDQQQVSVDGPPTARPNARDVGEFAPVDRPATLPPQTPITDTGEISIWEVFGVKRPSDEDTQTLTEFVQTVREREQTERAREIAARHLVQSVTPHPLRLRVRARAGKVGKALGLRLHLALIAARVRLRKPFG